MHVVHTGTFELILIICLYKVFYDLDEFCVSVILKRKSLIDHNRFYWKMMIVYN